MEQACANTARALAPLRGGRASTDLVAHLRVNAYGGSAMPLEQLASITVTGPRSLAVAPWDMTTTSAIRTAIEAANIGTTPQVDGDVIRLSFPAPSAERREELAKLAKAEAERGRVTVRNIRRDAINSARRAAKAGSLTEGRKNRTEKDLSAMCDEHIARIDNHLASVLRDIVM